MGTVEEMGAGGKKVLARVVLFSSLVLASVCCPLVLCVLSVGIRARPPSLGSALRYLLAIHMSAIVALSSHSIQWASFAFLMASEYLLRMMRCCSWLGWLGSTLVL